MAVSTSVSKIFLPPIVRTTSLLCRPSPTTFTPATTYCLHQEPETSSALLSHTPPRSLVPVVTRIGPESSRRFNGDSGRDELGSFENVPVGAWGYSTTSTSSSGRRAAPAVVSPIVIGSTPLAAVLNSATHEVFDEFTRSFWWREVLKLVDNFRRVASVKHGKGGTFLFWSDNWLINGSIQPTSVRFPRLLSYVSTRGVLTRDPLPLSGSANLYMLPIFFGIGLSANG